MRILVHICCAPCALFSFPRLKEEFEEVVGLWYNPNIHPFQEYRKRLDSVRDWGKKEKTKIIFEDKYELKDFLRKVVYRESQRCFICYYLRLEKTAIFARRGKFDYFGSTLIYSPHQNKDLIKEVAETVGKEYSLKPYLREFKEGWKESRQISKNMGLYHQQYCGCVYSEEERYKK